MQINFSGVGYRYQQDDIDVVVSAMLAESTLTQGQELAKFEKSFTDYMKSGHSFAFSNAVSAIDTLATVLHFREHDEVIVPSHTYTASAYPFLAHGATIVWCDIDPDQLIVTLDTILPHVSSHTKAIVVVDLYGLPVDIEPIAKFCKEKGIFLVSDSAQSLGGRYTDGTPSGAKADAAIFSFQSHKNVSTLGEGGVLWLSENSAYAERIASLRHNGHKPFQSERRDYWYPAMVNVDADPELLFPKNYCLGEVQCALGAHLMKKVDDQASIRRSRYIRANEALAGSPFKLQSWDDGRLSAHHLLPLRLETSNSDEDTNQVMRHLVNLGVRPAKQYHPLHKYSFYEKHGVRSAVLPATEKFYQQQISVPFQSWMSDSEFDFLLQAVLQSLRNER